MFGTGPFAVPTFQSLLESEHQVVALYTRPITDSGRRRKSAENPTRDAGEQAGLVIFDPPDVNASDVVQQLTDLKADLFVVCDYGQILSRDCLSAAAKGGINLHGSLLPKYRGAAPINWCLYHGDTVTGVTVIHMTPRLDGGPCLAQAELKIGPQETAEQIEPRLAKLGIEPVHRAIELLERWDGEAPIGEVQDQSLATRAPRLKKSDGLIDWTRPARELVNQIRAFQPWPGSFTNWHSSTRKQPVRLIIHSAKVVALSTHTAEPGEVVQSSTGSLVVQTGDEGLSIEVLQPAGKKAMPIADFLRGNPPAVGDRFES